MGLKNQLLNLFFPKQCLVCGQEDTWLCRVCENNLTTSLSHKYVAVSSLRIPQLNSVLVAGYYSSSDKTLAILIKNFKYRFIKELGPSLARVLLNEKIKQQLKVIFEKGESDKNWLIIPIPLTQSRQRWRGFNQSEILAKEIAAALKISLNLELKRHGRRQAQAKLKAAKRYRNVQKTFIWKGKYLKNTNIILIDDVVTTGATLNQAALTLRQAGARTVHGLVLAKG